MYYIGRAREITHELPLRQPFSEKAERATDQVQNSRAREAERKYQYETESRYTPGAVRPSGVVAFCVGILKKRMADLLETVVRSDDLSQFRYSGLASQGHAPIDSFSRFRGAGCGEVALLRQRRFFYGGSAQAELKIPFKSQLRLTDVASTRIKASKRKREGPHSAKGSGRFASSPQVSISGQIP